MTEATGTLVDSNVIIDVIRDDPQWAAWSMDAIVAADNPLINPMIFAELCYQQTSAAEVEQLMAVIGLGYAEIPREALFLASQAYRSYRQRGGIKTAPLADFFIGAHAQAAGFSLLTRDRSRYESYFPGVKLIGP
jgi:predicted nucleic acid-binding protein